MIRYEKGEMQHAKSLLNMAVKDNPDIIVQCILKKLNLF